MPKRTDIKKILIIGSGPIIIGQACEFDYSGTQACKALREEGYQVCLINSNPATIMTDPEFADSTYIEPLTTESIEKIIVIEKPDAVLPTLGGQTALNLAIELDKKNILKKYNVEMLGANPDVIDKAEDRNRFRSAMKKIGLDMPHSEIAHNMKEAWESKEKFADYPLVIRPSFTLGGTGGGIAYNDKDFEEICQRGLDYSPTSEILIEESILGWKEYELEVVRDNKDNCIIICSIENVDPMGVHTGDSITVAPAQTLTDREYQKMRSASIAVMREIGVETGGSNVQWAINPDNGRMIIIEMNPRVSRSSALASKATGFPIAKIAAKLAVGYTLDELNNDITQKTPACFEPSIDYVVTKIPRFTFEKFSGSDNTLTTQMKSVGEAMSIGRTFKQSLQKALRSLEIGRFGFGADGKDTEFESLNEKDLHHYIKKPTDKRLFYIRAALKRNWSVDKIYQICKIDKWFLRQLEELAHYEEEIKSTNLSLLSKDYDFFQQIKEFGYSDKQIAHLLKMNEEDVRKVRYEIGLKPIYSLVDTCAAEFEAYTPYYYSTYGANSEVKNNDNKKSIMIIGGGPNRIGQGIEFDYCCVHAAFALKKAGYTTIMVNSNPETVSTDYDTSDKLFFEPLTLEDILHIYEAEECYGAIVQFGGQTPLNLAQDLKKYGVNILGTQPEMIEAAEDRDFFQKLITKLNIKQPPNGIALNTEEAIQIANTINYPVLVRPSFVLGGRAMAIVYNDASLQKYMQNASEVSIKKPILIDKFLDSAIEVDVDCLSDGKNVVIGSIMEHVEKAGIHSGDSACIIPPISLSDKILNQIRQDSYALAKELQVVGLMNVQYAVQNEILYIIEVNPRASRTVPFLSKAIGQSLAKSASLTMIGKTLKELNFEKEIIPKYYSVKEAVFPFVRFPGLDIILSPEMKSTGEVMGIDEDAGIAFIKSQEASNNKIPTSGNVMVSVCERDKEAILPLVKDLIDLKFTIYATQGTSKFLWENKLKTQAIFKINESSPNTLDFIQSKKLQWIINTPSGEQPLKNEIRMRASATIYGIPITTTIQGFQAAISGLKSLKKKPITVKSIQEYTKS